MWLIFDGLDKSGKTTLEWAFLRRIDFKHHIVDRGPASYYAFDRIFNRVTEKGDKEHFKQAQMVSDSEDFYVVYCKASSEVGLKRIKDNNEVCPYNYDEAQNLLDNAVEKLYKKDKVLIIDTSEKSIERCADELVKWFIDKESKRSNEMVLSYTKVKDVKSPTRAHLTDAGIDFYIPSDFEETIIKPHESILIKSGIRLIIPDGYALIFKEKSSIATNKNLMVGAAVVDSSYRGEVHFHLYNPGDTLTSVNPNEKIIQGLIVPISLCDVQEIPIDEYEKNQTSRGEGGFGSTINI